MTDEQPRQLPLALPHEPTYERDDFVLGKSNRAAVAAIDAWPDWPAPVLLVLGPAGSGKTHLAHLWAARSGARLCTAGELDAGAPQNFAPAGCLVVEDADRGPIDEAVLFHLLNLSREEHRSLLITARSDPERWLIRLPDLRSRLKGARCLRLTAPDDAQLAIVLTKLFADRGIEADAALIDFAVRRIERSVPAAQHLADALDRRSLAEGRRVSRSMAGDLLRAWDSASEASGEGEL